MSDVIHNPVVVGLVVGVPSFTLGLLGYNRSKKADKAAEKTGAVEQVIDGLNKIVDNLQEDNKVLRDNIRELRDTLLKVTDERDKLKKQVSYLQRKYNPNYGQNN